MVKKNKNKKVLSPSQDQAQTTAEGDDELIDDLLAELDSRDQTVQHESATVLLEMQEGQENTVADKAQSATKKQDSKSRHEARQVHIHVQQLFANLIRLIFHRRGRQRPWLRTMHQSIQRQMQS